MTPMGDAALTYRSYIRGRLEIAAADFNLGGGQRFRQFVAAGGFFKFEPDGKTVAVKHRRLDETQRGHRDLAE